MTTMDTLIINPKGFHVVTAEKATHARRTLCFGCPGSFNGPAGIEQQPVEYDSAANSFYHDGGYVIVLLIILLIMVVVLHYMRRWYVLSMTFLRFQFTNNAVAYVWMGAVML
jgi:hypothetical protein